MYEEEEEEVRAPIDAVRERLIGNDDDLKDFDSDDEPDELQRAIKISILEAQGIDYYKNKKIRRTEKEEDNIIESMKISSHSKMYSGKNGILEALTALSSILESYGDEYLNKKISHDILLYENGLETVIELSSESYYEVHELIQLYLPDNCKTLEKIIKPYNSEEYFQYKKTADQSKKDTINLESVEAKQRKKILEPLFQKFKMLRAYDIESREVEVNTKNGIDAFLKNESEFIFVNEEHNSKFINIINSIKNKDTRDFIKNATKVKTA
jgi:hypothetical protein